VFVKKHPQAMRYKQGSFVTAVLSTALDDGINFGRGINLLPTCTVQTSGAECIMLS